ncbi:MAG TPA: DUF3500 domain-containing protein [Lapillicoccus sp.]
MGESAKVLRATARRFVDALDEAGRTVAMADFDTADRKVWTYLPGPRPGVAVGDLSDVARGALDELLGVTLSAMGADRTRQVMNLDDVLREVERSAGRSGWQRRSSERYWVRVLGDPDDDVWAWHLGGHHVGIHATVVGDAIAVTPCFLGANPAVVRSGPHAGLQVLREEEALARDLMAALTVDQLADAVVSPTAPDDIATRHDPVADPGVVPGGLRYEDMDRPQAQRLEALVRWYLGRAAEPVADQAWRAVAEAGIGEVSFAWAGPTTLGAPHYYSVKGATFLLEYDNTQDGANHAHTVWRDLRRDWGTDLLAEHHARAHR